MLHSAYMSEIFRSALGAVDPGQREAATSLGFGRMRAFSTVIFPQAVRIAIPSLVNQFIDIVKDSSIIAIIGTTDLMGVTNQLVSFYRAPFELYTLVGVLLPDARAHRLGGRRAPRTSGCNRHVR